MALITLQLADDMLGNHMFIDTDENSGFSVKWINPFFCVGVTELAHTQELSVPATEHNSQLFNLDNVVIAYGWRRGCQCWLGYSGGEIKGKLYIKDFEKNRYNLLFVYGAELDDVLSLPIDNFWQPNNSILIDTPKLEDIVTDFGWMNYDELHGNGNFANGANILPVVNLGWMMDEAAQAANYSFLINGIAMQNVSEAQFNPYNYCVNLDTINAGTEYTLQLYNFEAYTAYGVMQHQALDSLSNPVPDSAVGITISQKTLTWMNYNYSNVFVFEATRPITIILQPSNSVALRVNSGGYPGCDDPYNDPRIAYPVRLDLNAGNFFQLFYVGDYQFNGIYGGTPFNYTMTIIDSVTTANVGDYIQLCDNLPDVSLLQLSMNYCLITSSYFTIDQESKVINIYNINDVIARRFSNGAKIGIEAQRKLINIGKLFRYIEGYSQHNLVRCKSADYVVENHRFSVDYPCDNDLLDNENIFGEITFNDGNMNSDGEAVFENIEVGSGNEINLKPQVGVFFANLNGGYSYHIQWVENNYGMSAGFSALTATASSIYITIKEALFEFLKRNPEDLVELGSRQWLIQEATWQDDATELKLVSADDALATAPKQPNYLWMRLSGYINLGSQLDEFPTIEYSLDNGVSWIGMEFHGSANAWQSDNINVDGIILLRGDNPNGLADANGHVSIFGSNTKFECGGDIGTLIDMAGGEDLTIPDYAFMMLFAGSQILSTPEMPSVHLGKYSYNATYSGCNYLYDVSVLPADYVPDYAYSYMFNYCPNVLDIEIHAETQGVDSFRNWLNNASSGGTIKCPVGLSLPNNSPSGVPSGWTRVNL